MENEDFVEKCVSEYDSLMEETFFSANSINDLEERHLHAKTEILETLPRKWRDSKGSSSVPQTLQRQLCQRMDSTILKMKRHYEKSKEKEKLKLSALCTEKDALTYYNDEMEKYIQNHPIASPKEIDLNHVKVSKATLNLVRAKAGREGNTHEEGYPVEMEVRRKFYYERAQTILRSHNDPAIGIDLGTTMCCVMVYYKGKCELVPNRSQGNSRTTPSYVAFHDGNVDTFGYVAKEEAYKYPDTTIYDAKRMIGRPCTDKELINDMKKWPFEVLNDNGNPKIKTLGRLRSPHEISARLLTRFRLMAERHLKVPRGTIKKAVVTVPAYFTEPQRRATNDAAACAGLEVLNILSEPTAAAIAYSWERRDRGARTALIYDLGGGTFDVSVAMVTENNVDIIGVDGDTHLGGQDFDHLIMDHCLMEFKKKESVDLETLKNSNDKKIKDKARSAICRLKLQCEKAKERLSTSDSTTVQIEKIYDTHDLLVTITKSKMEKLVRPLVQKTIDIVERALEEAKTKGVSSKAEIDDIILVGGSTRMPLVMEMIQNSFNGKELCMHINPDEAVAYGAAIQAAILNKNESLKNIQVQDVTPLSLGIEIIGLRFSKIIPKNSKIPCNYEEIYQTVADNQTGGDIIAYQGEDPVSIKNKKLGQFYIGGFPPKPAGEEKAIVTMAINEMGILNVKAVSITNGNTKSITISADRIGLDAVTMNQIKKECLLINAF